jgi:hypothetical protein
LSEYDLDWQLATGRWVPVGSGLLFYGIYIAGGYQLLSWLHAFACAGPPL